MSRDDMPENRARIRNTRRRALRLHLRDTIYRLELDKLAGDERDELERRVAAWEAELVALDPGWVPPSGSWE